MKQLGPNLDALARRLRPVFRKHGVMRGIVFGSFARGEESRRSDLDLLVVQQTEKRFLDRYDGLLAEVVRAVPGRDVDLLIYTPSELARLAEQPFLRQALSEGQVIYESEQEPVSGGTVAADG